MSSRKTHAPQPEALSRGFYRILNSLPSLSERTVMECVHMYISNMASKANQSGAVKFLFSEVVSRQKKFYQVNFLLTLLVHHRKIAHLSKNKMLWAIGHLLKTPYS